jgi:hypothetical protein
VRRIWVRRGWAARSTSRGAWLAATLLAAGSCTPYYAVAPSVLPERRVSLDFANPLLTYEANANALYSLTQMVGLLGGRRESDADRSVLARTALALGTVYLTAALNYYSHEIAHEYEDREYGFRTGFHVDINDWGLGWPRYAPRPVGGIWAPWFRDADRFKLFVDGFNQNEYSSRTTWEGSCRASAIAIQDASLGFLSKLSDVYLTSQAGLEDDWPTWVDDPYVDMLGMAQLEGRWADVDVYVLSLRNRGITLGKRDYLVQALVADLLSWHTWESILCMADYVRTGQRYRKTGTWPLAGGHEITPPLISCYLTPLGTYYDMASFLDPAGAHPMKITLGTDVDFIGDGDVDRWRFGLQYFNLGWERLRFHPFVYLNSRKSLRYEGISVGLETYVEVSPGYDLRIKLEHNDGDIVENTVKGKDKGFGAVFGIDARF